jgi:hypothetical protein
MFYAPLADCRATVPTFRTESHEYRKPEPSSRTAARTSWLNQSTSRIAILATRIPLSATS